LAAKAEALLTSGRSAGASALAPVPKHFSSNHNYYIYGGGQPLRGLTVTVAITEDLVAPTGISLQLNAYAPVGDDHSIYQQYVTGLSPKQTPYLRGLGRSRARGPDRRQSAEERLRPNTRHRLWPCDRRPVHHALGGHDQALLSDVDMEPLRHRHDAVGVQSGVPGSER